MLAVETMRVWYENYADLSIKLYLFEFLFGLPNETSGTGGSALDSLAYSSESCVIFKYLENILSYI